MGVSWWGNQHTWEVDKCPLFRNEVEEEKVIQLTSPVVPAEKIHSLAEDCCRGTVATFWPKAVTSNFIPLTLLKIEPVKIISVMTVISTENIKLIIINYSTVWMSGTWASFGIINFLKWPFTRINTVFMKIVNSIKSVISSKNVYKPLIYNSSVPVSCWRRRIINW